MSSLDSQKREATKIYRAIFKQDIPAVLRDRFLTVSDKLNQCTDSRELELYYRALWSTPDLEALEVASRYLGRLPVLSLKFRAMVYLAETIPENQHFFVNDTTNRTRALWAFVSGGWLTAFKRRWWSP